MKCETPQLVLALNGQTIEIPCDICYKCDVRRRTEKLRKFREYRDRVRNYGRNYET